MKQLVMKNALKEQRKLKNFTQEELAKTSGISIRTIQRIEKGLSVGSPYTLKKLATSLTIEPSELLNNDTKTALSESTNSSALKLMNLSALFILLIPFGNILFPLFLFLKNKNNEEVNIYGRKILSFHIIWTVYAFLFILVVSLVLMYLFEHLRYAAVPIYVPLYLFTILINAICTLQISIRLSKNKNILKPIPNIL